MTSFTAFCNVAQLPQSGIRGDQIGGRLFGSPVILPEWTFIPHSVLEMYM